MFLFGGDCGWNQQDWTDSDDRVRGGRSQSYLTCGKQKACFHGHLDIKTLGGAGFASQRTTGENRHWDLSAFEGIELVLQPAASDDRKYTFILKDHLLPPNPDKGREQSTVSWEYDFVVPKKETDLSSEVPVSGDDDGDNEDQHTRLFIPWNALHPTYRGKERKDADKLKVHDIKRFSIMMRSFFGTQEGDFKLTIVSISAISKPSGGNVEQKYNSPALLWNWLFGRFWKL